MKKDWIFLLLFGLFLFFPFLFSDKVGGRISQDENRCLAVFPKLTLHEGIKEEFENWINDNAAGRDFCRNLYNYVDINILKTSYTGGDFYEDDWVFLMSDLVISRYLQRREVMTPEEQTVWIADYKKIKSFLDQRDVAMCSLVFPHKSEIYAERFRDYVVPLSEKSQLEVFKEMADADPELHLGVLYDILKAKTDNGEQLYSKAYDSSHWNNQGAWVGYQELMKEVQEEIPDVRILREEDMDISAGEYSKTYNWKEYVEEDLEYHVKGSQSEEFSDWFASVGYQSSDQWNSYRYYRNEDETLPKILIIGDSYVWMFMLPWISESFSETVFIHQQDGGNLEFMLETLKPDIVVFAGLQNSVENAVTQIAGELAP